MLLPSVGQQTVATDFASKLVSGVIDSIEENENEEDDEEDDRASKDQRAFFHR